MENDLSFVAPEGVYTITEEHKTTVAQNQAANAGPSLYPTKVASVLVRFPATKASGPPAALAQLLGAARSPREHDDGASLSSSETPDDSTSSTPDHTASSVPEAHTLFAHNSGKKRSNARPRHNIKTSSSTFITRIQTIEGLTRTLQSKQGEVTFLFYNLAKSYLWIEAGSKSRVSHTGVAPCFLLTLEVGTAVKNYFLRTPNVPRCELVYGIS